MRVPVVAGILVFPRDDDSCASGLAVLLQGHVKSEKVLGVLKYKVAALHEHCDGIYTRVESKKHQH